MEDMEELYGILSGLAQRQLPITYGDLTNEYRRRTRVYISPQAWGPPLENLNGHLHRCNYPALSVIVVLAGSDLPSYGFWGCCPSVPEEPETDEERRQEVGRIRDAVYATRWPMFLPQANADQH